MIEIKCITGQSIRWNGMIIKIVQIMKDLQENFRPILLIKPSKVFE